MDSRALLRSEEQSLRAFISYAREDEALSRELVEHLSFLVRAGSVDVWHDRIIRPGGEWKGEIDRNLHEADVILLLVSPVFGASVYCRDVEATCALERRWTGETLVVPVVIRPSEG